MRKPYKGERLQNRKSGAIVEVEGFLTGDGVWRVKLRNVDTGRKSEPKLDNVKKQYFLVGSPEEAADAAASIARDVGEREHDGRDLFEEEADDDAVDTDPDEGSYAEPDEGSYVEPEDGSYLVTSLVFITGFIGGLSCGVLLFELLA